MYTRYNSITIILLLLESLLGSAYAIAQNKSAVLSQEQALEDFKWLRFSLEYIHPRLYKYESKTTVDARFDSLARLINGPMPGLDFLALTSKANAAVRCGHLYTIPQGDLAEDILNKKVLPFYIKILDGKMYMLNNCSTAKIPNGSQILSINNKTAAEILEVIVPGVAADGNIHTRKIRLIERYFYRLFNGFDLYYNLHVDRSDTFKISYVEFGSGKNNTAVLNGISFGERATLLKERYNSDEQSWFTIASPYFKVGDDGSYAYLKVSRSFYDKKVDPDFDSLIRSAFHTIKERKIPTLILDLRDNEGGSEYQQSELMSYLYDQPFRLYQNIYLSHLDFRPLKPVIIERDTSSLVFNNDDEYMRKINESLWINNYEYDDNLKLKAPKEDVFKGKLYVLMNGGSFSSAADLISDIKKTRTAIFIGEESGGAFEGPTGGSNMVVQLPNSKIMVRISPNIQIGSLYQKHPSGRGVLPDFPIKYTVPDILAGEDLELKLARSLIAKSK